MLSDSFIRYVIDLFGVLIQAEQHFFQCFIPEFGASHVWLVVTNAVCCSDRLFFLLITCFWAKILPGFSFVSGHQGLHDQGEMREGIRVLMASILSQCLAGSFSVHRSTLFCHRHRLCDTRKINARLRSERPPTGRSMQPVYKFIFAKKTNINFIRGNQNSVYKWNEVQNHHGALRFEN